MEGLPATPKIKTRNSAKCDVEITLIGGSQSSTDSATLEIYENDVLVASYTMIEEIRLLREIDDANTYKYKVIPLGDTSNAYFDLIAGLKYGTKTTYPGITGVYTTYAETYTCPPSTGGMCDIEWEITKYAGSATHYEVLLWPTNGPFINFESGTVYPGTPLAKTVNSNFTYDLIVKPIGGGSREFFRFMTSTPYLNVALTFDLNTADPNQQEGFYPDFDYYDCP